MFFDCYLSLPIKPRVSDAYGPSCRLDCAKGSLQHCKGLEACSFALFRPLFFFVLFFPH